MQNPREEIVDIVGTLVTRPTLEKQAETLRKYFSPSVQFYHYYINTVGVEDLIAIYQFAETLINYQRVEFHSVAYDKESDIITLHITVTVKPFIKFFTEAKLEFLTSLELEEFEPDAYEQDKKSLIDGVLAAVQPTRKLKRVKVQRDYFERQPAILILPVIGDIYGSHMLRFVIGFIQAFLFRSLRDLVAICVPASVIRSVLGMVKDHPV